MKRILSIVLIITFLFVLVSCGNTEKNDSKETTSSDTTVVDATEDTTVKEDDAKAAFVCKLSNGSEIVIGAALPELGDYIDYSEAPSCVHEGMDKVYTYNGYSVTTSPDAKGNEYVSEVAILSDTVSMNDGITIGVSKDTIVSALGDEFTEAFGVMTYETKNATVSVILDESSNVMSFVVAFAE